MPKAKEAPAPNTYVLSPSDLTYLWDDCPRCFWLRYVKGQRRPGAFPRVFGQIDRAMRAFYEGRILTVPGVGTGKFDCSQKTVKTPETAFGKVTLSISGRLDARLVLENGVALVDFKCSGDKEGGAVKYRYQLAAYALGIEHTLAQKVHAMGLYMFDPTTFTNGGELAALHGKMYWLPIERNDAAFNSFLGEVAELLGGESPALNPECYFCKYTEATR
jgi:hypothetical protein